LAKQRVMHLDTTTVQCRQENQPKSIRACVMGSETWEL
jgi:hypothetical protein